MHCISLCEYVNITASFYQNNSWPSLVDVDVAVAAAAAVDEDAPGGHGG